MEPRAARGLSGAGKASALKTFEDLGYQAVDNLPLELMPEFAGLVQKSKDIDRAAIVVDVREGQAFDRLPEEVNAELDGLGRVLVRPSGTEPVVRVLTEAETAQAAEDLCAKVAALVTHELG